VYGIARRDARPCVLFGVDPSAPRSGAALIAVGASPRYIYNTFTIMIAAIMSVGLHPRLSMRHHYVARGGGGGGAGIGAL
jgi:hypothetical protein